MFAEGRRTVKYRRVRALPALAGCVLAAFFGCAEDLILGETGWNEPPEAWLSSGPVAGDTTSYRVHFYWGGWDPDGEIKYFEFLIADGNPIGFNPEDTIGLDKWGRTVRHDSIFSVEASESASSVVIGSEPYTRYDMTHTFFLRSVDGQGKRSAPAYRSFTAWTLAPYAIIDTPRNPFPGQAQILPPVTRFQWHTEDPIDSPWEIQQAESTRHVLLPYTLDAIGELNADPGAYEESWRPWMALGAAGDSGISTMIGDDENLANQASYIFVVQAKDEAGAVTTIFDPKTNVRIFAILQTAGPVLRVSEPYLGAWQFIGVNNRAEPLRLPAGFVFRFSWEADASSYGGEIVSYRYGWDVIDLNDPSEWAVDPNPYIRSALPIAFVSGVHTLSIEAVDNNGIATIAQVEINTFMLSMERNLLWVDDFYSTNDFMQVVYAFPTEAEHDQFWMSICRRAVGFGDADVFETAAHNRQPPDIELLWRYKNVIWTYSSRDDMNAYAVKTESDDDGCWESAAKRCPVGAITLRVLSKRRGR